jgi:hypothetical protein
MKKPFIAAISIAQDPNPINPLDDFIEGVKILNFDCRNKKYCANEEDAPCIYDTEERQDYLKEEYGLTEDSPYVIDLIGSNSDHDGYIILTEDYVLDNFTSKCPVDGLISDETKMQEYLKGVQQIVRTWAEGNVFTIGVKYSDGEEDCLGGVYGNETQEIADSFESYFEFPENVSIFEKVEEAYLSIDDWVDIVEGTWQEEFIPQA